MLAALMHMCNCSPLELTLRACGLGCVWSTLLHAERIPLCGKQKGLVRQGQLDPCRCKLCCTRYEELIAAVVRLLLGLAAVESVIIPLLTPECRIDLINLDWARLINKFIKKE